MARIRSIKPDMRRSLTVASWPIPVRWTFVGLLGYLDDEGRGIDDTRLVKAELYPLDDEITRRKLDGHLRTITDHGPLCRYEVAGQRYMHIVSWKEHQRVNRPSPSQIPPCPIHEASLNGHAPRPEDSRKAHGGLTEDSQPSRAPAEQGREGKGAGKGREVSGTGPSRPQVRNGQRPTTTIDDDGLDQIAKITHGDRQHAARVADDVLDRTTTDIRNPLAYVLRSVRERPEQFTANSSRHPPGPRDPQCPRHPGEHRDRCRCCAADRIAGPRPLEDTTGGGSDEPPF